MVLHIILNVIYDQYHECHMRPVTWIRLVDKAEEQQRQSNTKQGMGACKHCLSGLREGDHAAIVDVVALAEDMIMLLLLMIMTLVSPCVHIKSAN